VKKCPYEAAAVGGKNGSGRALEAEPGL
jgi:hypothetical protein